MRTLLGFCSEDTLQNKLLRKLHSVTGPQHQTAATCNAKFSTIAGQVAEKIAKCNRAFRVRIRIRLHSRVRVSLYNSIRDSVTFRVEDKITSRVRFWFSFQLF